MEATLASSPAIASPLERDAEFDEAVDAEGPLELRGKPFVRSDVLASDPIAYREALAEYREARQAELLDLATDRFPYPVAHCLYRYLHSAETENQRLQFLKDTWEALVHVCFALTVAEVRRVAAIVCIETDQVRDFRTYLDSRSLRHRLEVLRHTLLAAPDLPLTASIIERDALERMIELNQHRNEDFAHLGTLNERQSRALIEVVEPEVLAVLRSAQQLANVEFVRYLGPGSQRGQQKLEVFTGHSPNRRVQPRSMTPAQAALLHSCTQREVTALWGDALLRLSPMIVWREGRGYTSQLAFLKKRRVVDRQNVFTFEIFGDADEFDDDASVLMEDLAAIKNLYQSNRGNRE